MKWLLGVILLAGIVLAALMYVPMENGRPILSPEDVRKLVDDSVRTVGVAEGPDEAEAVMYRWKDRFGKWQYGDVPPPGVAVEVVEKKEVRTVSGPEQVLQVMTDTSENP